MASGLGKYVDESQNLIYEGNFKKDLPHGKGKLIKDKTIF